MLFRSLIILISTAVYAYSLSCFDCGSGQRNTPCQTYDASIQQNQCSKKENKCFEVGVEFLYDEESTVLYQRGCSAGIDLCKDYKLVYGKDRIMTCKVCTESGCNNHTL
ncbi:hypothetical protein HHI36_012234 [Cryptolaemus montrouzieri]|uniref:Uncharacterized protein n=1 Tax=Cryptolaemus montrouzieri TaxID=559131 RepID=A0ABD2NEE1_9CUCU